MSQRRAWWRSWWREERRSSKPRSRRMALGAGLLVAVLVWRQGAVAGLSALLLVLLLTRIQQQLQRRRRRLHYSREQRLQRGELRGSHRLLDELLRQLGGPELVPAGSERNDLASKIRELSSRLNQLLRTARWQTQVDPLTQLPNRQQFLEQIQVASGRAVRASQPFAVLFIDIDHFRSLNDTYGHAVGDRALIAVARKLQDTVRLGDFLARYGSDEFAVLMDLSAITGNDSELLRSRAFQFASRLVQTFSEGLDLGDTQLSVNVSVGISIGISVVQPGTTEAESILRNLDNAIVQAKQQRHERVAIFDVNSSGDANLNDYQLFHDLQEAMRNRSLHMAFQPVVDRDGAWKSLEALARWQHPSLGFIAPDRFIALAERYRLIRDLGDLIFELSLQGYLKIREATGLMDLRLNANISPTQLSDPDLHRRLVAMLRSQGLTPEQLTLEITEASVLECNEATSTNLQQLRKAGFRLSLDDFGTGYSSLNLLHRLQPNEVKIDRSFVIDMNAEGYARQIITVVAQIAREMNLELVAEGVEDETMLQGLRELGVPLFQGYYFSRPMPADALIASRGEQA